jgi:hypothetical protein
MYKLTLQKLREVDEYFAIDLLEFNNYEAQRPVKERHLTMLCNEINSGHFLVGDIAIAKLTYDGNRNVLVNGQHQLKAVVKVGKSINAVYQEYMCSSPNDLSELYRRFDNHQARSLGDILSPEAIALGVTWKRSIVRLVVAAASFGEAGFHGSTDVPKVEKVKYISQYLKQGSFVNHILEGGKIKSSHLKRAAVVFVMMKTWDKDKHLAELFWESVMNGIDLTANSPMLVLRNYLLTSALGGSNKLRVSNSREMQVKCIHAWNAYRSGSKTSLKYHPNAPIPKII